MNDIYHHGIKGMHWGVRRYQNADGSLTSAGKNRYQSKLSGIREKKSQNNEALSELRSYERNPSKMGSSKISTAIRRHQIKSLERSNAKLSRKEQATKKAAQKEYDDNYQKNYQKNYIAAYNKAADYANSTLIPKINKKYAKYDWSKRETDSEIAKAYERYVKEYQTSFDKVLQQNFKDIVGKRPE